VQKIAMNQTESSEATPEQLFQMLDAQLAAQRSQSGKSSRNRAILLVGGILFIVVAAGASLLVLDQMLMDMRDGTRPAPAPAQTSGNN
jgi:hypothetical protein